MSGKPLSQVMGTKRNHAAGAAVVRHDDAPPFARGVSHNAALMEPESAIVGVGRGAGAAAVTPMDSP